MHTSHRRFSRAGRAGSLGEGDGGGIWGKGSGTGWERGAFTRRGNRPWMWHGEGVREARIGQRERVATHVSCEAGT